MERYRLLSSTETYDEKQQQALSHCDHLIRDFAKRADRHKLRYKRLQRISIFLAALTTVLSALSASKVLGELDWIVLAISGLATLSTTLLSQTNSQKLWVQSRSTSQKFQTELFLCLQESGEYAKPKDSSERLKAFSRRLMEIWAQAQETWSQGTSSGK
jgi:hypothetical protein